MKDEEILQKVLNKVGDDNLFTPQALMNIFDDKTFNTYGNNLRMDLVRGYIFSHDFAKAFFGEGTEEIQHGNWDDMKTITSEYLPAWKVHLSRMVLEENPLKYLEQFLDPELLDKGGKE